ncbi:MAG: hypothetical protein DRR19_21535 [Candidatus Parabeggiatoa sp. nov. 1]|nr:MAG: hypothetical protein DRR19_21535 [Gammaproteobacteria bacterium]
MNKQFESYFLNALYNAKIEQIIKTYKDKGFSCTTFVKIDDVQFDVIVKNPEKTIAFEIQVAPKPEDLKHVETRHQKAKSLGYNFRVVTINKPINPAIAIGWLNQALSNYLLNNPPKILQSTTYHTHLNQVKTEAQSIEISELSAKVYVEGGIYVDFQYGADEERLIEETFPFEGEILLNLVKKEIKQAQLNIDDSHWCR